MGIILLLRKDFNNPKSINSDQFPLRMTPVKIELYESDFQ